MLGQNLKCGRLTRRQALVVGGGALAGAAIAGPIFAPERYHAGASNGGQTREYFIAAEEVDWDYAPSGKDLITGEPFSESAQVFTEPGPNRRGDDVLRIHRTVVDGGCDLLTFRRTVETGHAFTCKQRQRVP